MVEVTKEDAVEALGLRPVVRIDGQTTLRRAAEMLTEESIGAAIVRSTHPPALLSERDIVRALAEGANPDRDHVDDVMTLDVLCVSPQDSVADVARLMLANEVRHLPVVDGNAVVSVVSARDVLRAFASE